jgi:hypothetical protein
MFLKAAACRSQRHEEGRWKAARCVLPGTGGQSNELS